MPELLEKSRYIVVAVIGIFNFSVYIEGHILFYYIFFLFLLKTSPERVREKNQMKIYVFQLYVHLVRHLVTDGQTHGRMDGYTDRRTQSYIVGTYLLLLGENKSVKSICVCLGRKIRFSKYPITVKISNTFDSGLELN